MGAMINPKTLASYGEGPQVPDGGYRQNLSADGAIGVEPGFVILSKVGAGAYTLAAPTLDLDGLELLITTTTAAAHVVTIASLADGTTTAKSKATAAAFAGCSLRLVAANGKWNVVSNNAFTLAA